MQDLMTNSATPDAVAVIGAGPGGLVAARWLIAQGFAPVIFDAADHLGGQWNTGADGSGTWRHMRTNTSRVLSAFSDLDHAPGTATYPTQGQMLAYLDRYAASFGLTARLRLGTRVEHLERAAEGGWRITSQQGEVRHDEVFARVVIATGRHRTPELPQVPGLETFTGDLGVAHTQAYAGARRYAGASVVVAGCSISALEIAADLALGGAGAVTSTTRRQRYILPKLIQGVPTDHVMFTRAAALTGEVLPVAMQAAGLRAAVLGAAGNPAQFGAPEPDPNIFLAGVAQSQSFLPCVAEGRITPRPWIRSVEGRRVHFADGSVVDADAILFGTGYRLSLPWLAPEIAHTLELDASGLTLHAQTFHPDLPGLAFLGLYDLIGPYLPVLELQARWIAQSFAGQSSAPSLGDMAKGLVQARQARQGPPSLPMHVLAVMFARLIGAEPDLGRWPDLERALLFGPLSPVSFRLQGPDAHAGAVAATARAAAEFGHITHNELEPGERARTEIIRAVRPLERGIA